MVKRNLFFIAGSFLWCFLSGIVLAMPAPSPQIQVQKSFAPAPDVVSEHSVFVQSPSSVVIPAKDGMPAGPVQQFQPPQLFQQPPPPALPGQPTEEEAIYLNFDNASLASVVSYLGEQKKVNIIPHKDLESAKVTLTMRNPLTLERAWSVMLTLLEANGFSLIKVGDLYRVVLSQNNGQEPLPTFSSQAGVEPENLPDSDMVIRYVYYFKNIKVETAKAIMARMIDEKNIIENKDLNVCVIKDQSFNIKAALRIVKELDNSGLREAISIIPLRWASADNIKELFKGIMGTESDDRVIRFAPMQQKESAYFSKATTILAEPIKNSLILLGQQKNIDKIRNFVEKYLDVPIEDADSRLHIKELSYAKAQDIKPMIDDLIKPPKGASEKGLILEGGYKAFEDVIVFAESDDAGGGTDASTSKRGGGNRLIVACNRDDWMRIDNFVTKIDKPQPQVAIEVLIIDVTNGQTRALGTQLYNIKGNPLAKNVNVEFDNLTAGIANTPPTAETPATGSAFNISEPFINLAAPDIEGNENATFMTLGKSGIKGVENIWAFVKSVINVDNAQVISQPYIIANNNQKCIVSSQTIFRIPGKVETKSLQTVRQQETVPATVKVELTPYVNLNGMVDLTVDVSVEEFTSPDPSDDAQKSSRSLKTKANMAAGEVLVLGGLTKSKQTEELNSTPLLSWIPIIGNFFKSRKKVKQEINLYIFIRPSVIKPRFEGNPDEYTQLKLDYAKYQIMKNDGYVKDQDPIQRWFFKPTNQTIKHRLADAARGILRPVDNFSYGRQRPKMASIQDDPYFQASEALAKKKRMAPVPKAPFGPPS